MPTVFRALAETAMALLFIPALNVNAQTATIFSFACKIPLGVTQITRNNVGVISYGIKCQTRCLLYCN